MTEPMPYLTNLPRFTEPTLCSQADPDAWFPEPNSKAREAKATCNDCRARLECLAYALKDAGLQGIWGGLTEKERGRLRRRIAARAAA